jgi:hypothetical protein
MIPQDLIKIKGYSYVLKVSQWYMRHSYYIVKKKVAFTTKNVTNVKLALYDSQAYFYVQETDYKQNYIFYSST